MSAARPLSICFVAPMAYPVLAARTDIEVVGGAEVQQCAIARELARRGHRVSMISLDYGQREGDCIDGVRLLKTHAPDAGVPVLRFVHPRLTGLWSALRRADADLYYQRTAGVQTAYVAAFAQRHGRASVFASAHDADFDAALPLFRFARDRALYRFGVRRVDAVVVQSDQQRRRCAALFGREATPIASCYAHAGAPARHDGPVLWVATARRHKRPHLLLELARRLPERRFELVGGPASGPGERRYYDALRERAAALPNIACHGFVAYADIERHFDDASVFVNTSIGEGFPNTFLQAWSRGMPTLSFFDPATRLDGRRVGRVVDDLDAMADELRRLLADRREWSMEGERARRLVEQRHSPRVVVDAYERLFAALPACRRSGWRAPPPHVAEEGRR